MEAIKIDTIYIMEQYNFNKPITTKIIYDSDEQTSEEIIARDKSVQYEKRQSVTKSSNVGLNLGEQTQTQISNQLKINAENDMLNEAIGYISAIVETYLKFSQECETLSTAKSFKLKYLNIKYLIFKKSLTVAKFLLLPQKSNELFIHNIITEVLNRANLQSNMYNSIRLLYADLLAWTESQLGNKKKEAGTENRLRSNTIQPNHNVPHLNSGIHSDHRKRGFSHYDIIRETTASSEMLRKNSAENVESCFPPPNHTKNSITEKDRTSQLEMQTLEQNIIYPSDINMIYQPPNYTSNNSQKNYLSESNYLNHVINIQDTQNHLRTHPFRAHTSIGYQERVQRLISQNLLDNNLSRLEKNSVDGRDISRSSISRDSGFMSPDILISPRESTITNNQDLSLTWQNAATDEALMPNISSTNNIVGACHVCGTQTELLCLGCFQYFYCSKNCQNVHWQLHKSRCRTSLTS